MESNERREKILQLLKENKNPIKGTILAKKFNVSRQVIVQDVAILRAAGEDIIATPQGYFIPYLYKDNMIIKTIACQHNTYDDIEEELKTIVDLGAKIIDVIVEHPLYGEIKSHIQVSSREDVKVFMENIKGSKAEPLSSLTEGIHLHTIEVSNEEMYERIKEELRNKNILINGN